MHNHHWPRTTPKTTTIFLPVILWLSFALGLGDISNANQWTVNVMNNGDGPVMATGMTFRVSFSGEERGQFI